MRAGLIYLTPFIYRAVSALIYGARWDWKFKQAAAMIPEHSSVLDLCAGEGYLSRYLSPTIAYTGIESMERFVRYGRQQGRNLLCGDVATMDFPTADTVVMLSSFYHFIDNAQHMVDKMKSACRRRVIIFEGTWHLTNSSRPLLRKLGRLVGMTDPLRPCARWTSERLGEFAAANGFDVRRDNDYLLCTYTRDLPHAA